MLETRDITGEGPRCMPAHSRTNFHDPADIEGAQSRPLHQRSRSRGPAGFHDNADVEGSKPCAVPLAKTTRRAVDPLVPAYGLAHVEPRPPTPPPFKHDFLNNIADIEGAAPASFYARPARAEAAKPEVEGSKPRPRTKSLSGTGLVERLHVADINNEGVYRSQRVTDPVQPVYTYHSMVLRDGPDSRPAQPKKGGTEPWRPLNIHDIEGASPAKWGNVKVGGVKLSDRTSWRVTNDLPARAPAAHPLSLLLPSWLAYVLPMSHAAACCL